ncbi:MAG: D-alanyl-D-alanine carboxypeptidase, partial [Rhodospirillaceae bacterium]|nr:D-alanyl-D-alanine carboxypeptidase [Rhodospirillaceae bacterium]
VVNGLASKKARSQEPERLLEWAFRDFNNYALFKAGEKIEDAQVWLGEQPRVPMMIGKDVTLTIPRKARRKMKVSVTYKAAPAPVAKGDVIGQLKVKVPGRDDMIVPLVAGADVARLGVIGRLWAALSNILFGEAG